METYLIFLVSAVSFFFGAFVEANKLNIKHMLLIGRVTFAVLVGLTVYSAIMGW